MRNLGIQLRKYFNEDDYPALFSFFYSLPSKDFLDMLTYITEGFTLGHEFHNFRFVDEYSESAFIVFNDWYEEPELKTYLSNSEFVLCLKRLTKEYVKFYKEDKQRAFSLLDSVVRKINS